MVSGSAGVAGVGRSPGKQSQPQWKARFTGRASML